MLVGNEHRYKVISPRAVPLQLYSMFCPRTVFGDIVLSGTIPGLGSISSNISNNVVTLFGISCNRPSPPSIEETEQVEPIMLDTASNTKQDKDNKIWEKFQRNSDIPLICQGCCLVFSWWT